MISSLFIGNDGRSVLKSVRFIRCEQSLKTLYSQNCRHLLLYLAGFLSSHFRETFRGVCIDDGAGTVDDEAAVVVPSVLAHLFEAAALSPDAGNEQEVVGGELADVGEGAALGGADDVHQAFRRSPLQTSPRGGFLNPLLTSFDNNFKQPFLGR